MKITEIDYWAVSGKCFLNFYNVKYKLAGVFAILLTVIFINNIILIGVLYLTLLLFICFSALPAGKILKLSFYPLIFLVLFLISLRNTPVYLYFLYILKGLTSSSALLILVFTTPFIKIFTELSKILPNFLVLPLFMTYRALFVLVKTLENLLDSTKFRGISNIKNPVRLLKVTGGLIGFFVIKSIQTGENIYEAMRIRGYIT